MNRILTTRRSGGGRRVRALPGASATRVNDARACTPRAAATGGGG